MTTKKTAAKKTTAKKTAAPQEQHAVEGVGQIDAGGVVGTAEPAPEPEPAPPTQRLGTFPLPEGHYFHPPVVAPSAHHGGSEQDRAYLRPLQDLLGAPPTGVYDDETERLVLAWKEARGLGHSPIVDAQTWQQISEA